MIREKIFRLHRHKSSSSSAATDASAQKFDFAFSNIQAIQVPKGWDKVTLSLISSESGRAVRKTGKVTVKNGTCQWSETFSESIWISGSKDVEEYLFKFVLAAGSSKSSSLGEFTVNLAAFLSSASPMLVSLPLKKSDYGTILQVEVKCLTPKTNLRGEKWKEMQANIENEDHDDIENQSELSDSTSASNNVGNSSRARELSSRETSFSASVSRYSFDSMDDSVGRQSFSSQSRQNSIESNDSSYSTRGTVRSQGKNQASLQRNVASSKVFKEVDDGIVQELEAEAIMWEQHTRRLSVEVEKLRKELSNQNVELDRSRLECHEFSQEIGRLRLLLEEATVKQSDDDQSSAWSNIHKEELEDEMKFQKEDYENMSLQFKMTQESNIELISILQEMEQTVDEQKLELQKSQELQRALQGHIFVLEDKIIGAEMEQDLKNRIVKEFGVECKHRLVGKDEKIRNLEDALSRALLDDDLQEFQELKEKVQELTEENLDLLFELKELRMSNSDETNGDLRLMEHLSELQEENVYLSQRVSGLEAQLRYLTDKSESSSSELHHSESKVRILECQITRLEEELESQKIDTKQKLLEKEKQWEEAQEECTSLSKLNIMLQGTIENLIDEYNCLQSFNGEVREQKMKLQEHCLVLESAARKYRENLDSSDKDSNELESRIKMSELERVRLAEQNSLMHMQLQRVTKMENEVLALRVLVREMKSRNQLLEASFKSVSEDYEEVKREKDCMAEKISSMQRVVMEAEECTRRKNLLEEKVLRLEGDMIVRDVLCVQDVEIKNEMNQVKIANSKLLMKVKYLEEIQSDSRNSEVLVTENEFAKALKGNDMRLESDRTVVAKSEDKIRLMEAELQEICDRYLQISMKYAEVEAEREELVMKLKAHNI